MLRCLPYTKRCNPYDANICLYVCACPCLQASNYTYVRTCAGGTLTWKCRIMTRRRRRNMSGTHGVLMVPSARPVAVGYSRCSGSVRYRIDFVTPGFKRVFQAQLIARPHPRRDSLGRVRAGTDRHGAASAIAKRATATLTRMPAADGCGVVEPSPGADVAGVSPGPSWAHSGEVCACEGARRRGAADRGRVSALARCALRRRSDARNRQALRGMVRSHRIWKHA